MCAQFQRARTRKEGKGIKEQNRNKRIKTILLQGGTIRVTIFWIRDRLTTALFLSIVQDSQCLHSWSSEYLQPWPWTICIGPRAVQRWMEIKRVPLTGENTWRTGWIYFYWEMLEERSSEPSWVFAVHRFQGWGEITTSTTRPQAELESSNHCWWRSLGRYFLLRASANF